MASSLSESETMNTVNTNTVEESDPDTAYCKICEINLEGMGKAAYSYCRKGGNTTNLIAHLWNRHHITKKNYLQFLDKNQQPRSDQLQITNYINVSTPCSYKWQEEITKNLIPCDKTIKGILYLAYEWSKEQLCSLLSDNIIALLVLEGLKQYKPFHRQIKSLQAFFHSPKQGQKLHAMQQKHSQQGYQSPENEHTNPLEVLTDVKTRILKLHNYMRLVYIDLLSKPDRAFKKGEKLEHLCLSLEEREFLQQMISLLEPIEYELWSVSSDISLITMFLDPRFKDFEWYNGKGKAEAELMVQEFYYNMDSSYQPTNVTI
ncbi:14080_t:CDS:2 [Gigaspora margarita]|uniref:14080_t:CDS:1 n=1 Tax=Gigaspora margarita TaxID=4874 RepID=A0ABN7VB89_GIGMA|nr:14080_t:CDS:2 [Gigaspora margarita]